MRKKFIRVAVFCALTATAAPVFVGCSDYDDDINRLQGEIDQINGVIGVSGEEMAAAIQTAIDGLQAELDQAIAGKADDAAVQQLQATVQQLVDAMESEDGSIDANLIQQLTGEIEALKVEVNNTKGNLDEQNANLVFNLFRELVHDEGAAVVMVTHDRTLAQKCDHCFEMVDGVIVNGTFDDAVTLEPEADEDYDEKPGTMASTIPDYKVKGEQAKPKLKRSSEAVIFDQER